MSHVKTQDPASEFAETAMAKMREMGIPPDPQNFLVWFNYVANREPELVRTIDSLIGEKAAFTYDRNLQIYQKFFGLERQSEEIDNANLRIQTVVDQVLSFVGEARQDTGAFGEKLSGFSDQLASGANIQTVIESLVEETQKIVEKSHALEASLDQSSTEIADLRRHLEEVRQEAVTDALTGIPNRKYFDLQLRDEAAAHGESGESLCLLLLDIDHFKKFNDNFGHRVGDEVLKLMGRVLSKTVKGQDTPARYGGEEFAVVLPRTKLTDAATVADQLRQSLARRDLTNKKTGQNYGKITISVGVAAYRPGESLDDFIQRADAALYRAKDTGRNRVVTEAEMIDVEAS